MRSVSRMPVYLESEYVENQQKNFERYMFVTNKYQTIGEVDQDELENQEMRKLIENE